MNIISALVGVTIMGAAAPSVMQMSIAPIEAQKRAENFGIAESAAVTYAANYEGTTDTPESTSHKSSIVYANCHYVSCVIKNQNHVRLVILGR